MDVANIVARCAAEGTDPVEQVTRYPLEAVSYMHIAGGTYDVETGLYLDTHAHPIQPVTLAVLQAVLADSRLSGAHLLIERDGRITVDMVEQDVRMVSTAVDGLASGAASIVGSSLPAREVPDISDSVAARQHTLLSSMSQHCVPEKYDAAGVQVAAQMLDGKRAEGMLRTLPDIALIHNYRSELRAYFRKETHPNSSFEDVKKFVEEYSPARFRKYVRVRAGLDLATINFYRRIPTLLVSKAKLLDLVRLAQSMFRP